MRTIDALLKYNITPEEEEILLSNWYINWCWWKWWFSFDKILDYIWNLEYIDKEKFKQFKIDLRRLCYEHDIDFARWWFILAFLKANDEFVSKALQLMHWINNEHLKYIKWLFWLWMNIWWIKYFRWGFKTLELSILLNKQ